MKKFIRNVLSHNSDFKFEKCNTFSLEINRWYGLYVHVPFCKNNCPYCPYYKTIYEKYKSYQYVNALKREINLTSKKYPHLEINSLYFGGGTPTLLNFYLIDLINYLKSKFNITEEIAIETSPIDLNEEKLKSLKRVGVNSISIGIQSFKDNLLKEIGRNYDSKNAVEIIKKVNFETINLDMMFALPTQTIKDLEEDIEKVIELYPSQVTFYPLFTFPYTSVGKFIKIKKVKMPNFFMRKKMYYLICKRMKSAGYQQSSVWAFKKGKSNKFSSVTRDFYIGFGPSAGTYTGKNFYFNTFSLDDYFKITKKRKPIILRMNVNERMRELFWLYWRFYETKIPKKDYEQFFKSNVKKNFKLLFYILKILGCIKKEDNEILQLNMRGIFYIHLIQNIFALNYVNKIWSTCQETKNPKAIEL